MTSTQREFYEFISSLSDEELDNWLVTASDEEVFLADKLFDEVKLNTLDKVEDLSEANNLLKQFTLKG